MSMSGRPSYLKKSNRIGHRIAIAVTDAEYEQILYLVSENNTTIANLVRVALNRAFDVQFRDRLDWNGAEKEAKI